MTAGSADAARQEPAVASRATLARLARLALIDAHTADLLWLLEVGPGDRFVCLSMNRAAVRSTGLAEADVVGRRVEALPPPAAGLFAVGTCRAAIAGGVPLPYDAAYDGPAGPVIVEVTLVPVCAEAGLCTHLLAVARDVTARRHAEAALRASEARFRALVAASPLGVFHVDRAGGATYVNPRLTEITGAPAGDLLGTAWTAHVHPDDRGPVLAGWRADLAAGRESTRECRLQRRDGTVRWVCVHLAPLGREAPGAGAPSGETDGSIGTVEDVTDRRALEAQLRQAQKMEAVGRLASGIAHDFNNLLTVVSSYAELAHLALPEGDPVRDDVAEIAAAARRAAQLTGQLLAFGRQQVLHPAALDLSRVVDEVQAMLRPLLGDAVVVITALARDLPPVLADRGQVEQVLLNLAVNARDAMPAGGTLELRTSVVPPRPPADTPVADWPVEHAPVAHAPLAGAALGAAPDGWVALTVRDTGTGMDVATRSRLFEPFFTTKAVGKGTGLGLATVYGIVRQSGGWIAVDSAPGAGTTFTVHLPVIAGGPAAPVRAAPAEPAPPSGVGAVLLVEDSEAVRRLARRVLEGEGYLVLDACDAAAAALALAARHAARGGPRIRVLLTDVVMPGLSGPELARRLRALDPTLGVLFMSGYAPDDDPADDARTAADAPGIAFLAKPFDGAALVRTVQALEAARLASDG